MLSPALAKNGVGVAGSSYNPPDTMAGFSSSGPTFDGRVKPDITTPGSFIMSAMAEAQGLKAETCLLRSSSGTSMSTPAAAGVGALLRQYLRDPTFWASLCNTTYPLCNAKGFMPSAFMVFFLRV